MKLLVGILTFILVLVAVISLLSNGGDMFTGSVIVGKIACFDNADCDDGITATEDLCRNPGSEYSLCVNK